MDLSWLKLRRRVLGVTVALTCASSLSFSGCLKSARDVVGFGKSPSESAILAEKELQEKRRQDALLAESERESAAPTAKVQLPDSGEGLGRSQDERVAGKVNAGPIQQVTGTADAQGLGRHWDRSADSDIRSGNTPSETALSQSRPNPFEDRGTGRKSSATEPTSKNPDSSAKSKIASSRVVGPTPPDDWEANPWSEPAKSPATPQPKPTPDWAVSSGPTSSAEKPAPEVDSSAIERLKVRNLLSESLAHQIRGELHAAYRSALLAERLAEDAQLTFTEDEANPRDVAKQIADRIWQKPEVAVKPASPRLDDQLPIISPAPAHAFASAEAFAQWRSAPPVQANSPVNLAEKTESAAGLSSSGLPKIQASSGWPSNLPLQEIPDLRGPSIGIAKVDLSSPPPLQLPDVEGRKVPDSRVQGSQGTVSDSGVEFAIARRSVETSDIVIPGESANRFVTQPAPFPVDISGLIDKNPPRSSRAQDERPVLLAPGAMAAVSNPAPEPLAPAAFRVPVGHSPSWEEIKETFAADDATVPGEEHSLTNLKWGIVGIIAAILATLIGIRMTGSPGGQSTPPVAAAAPPEADEDDRHQLRIKRAA